ncbi:MAG TPA: hypothetical protein PLK99_13145, partial [Burkholderiales bacterium]|nr:hypothetical protein [Burkholderiales bacterium]
RHWNRIRFGSAVCSEENDALHWEVQVYLDDLPPEAVSVELYAEPEGGEPTVLPLEKGMLLAGASNAYVYQISMKTDRPSSDFTPRIVPAHREAKVPQEANFILWYG